MAKKSNISVHDCIFRYYMDHRAPAVFGERVGHGILGGEITLEPDGNPLVPGRIVLVRDIPDFLVLETRANPHGKSFKVPQYQGYLVDLREFGQIDDYLKEQLSRRNHKNLRSKKRALEKLGRVEYRVLSGPMDGNHYARAFETFYALLKRRFDQKRIWNRDLGDWDRLYRQALPRLLEGHAALFIISLEGKAICMALDYFLGESVFSHIQTYDMDFAKYNLGDIHMLFQLQWCLDQGKSIFDLSKGHNPYKEKWCNHSYRLHHEIHYGPSSFTTSLRARTIALKYRAIQQLRELGILGNFIRVDRWLYYWRKDRLADHIHIQGPKGVAHVR